MSKVFEALERLAMPDELHIEECKKAGIGLTEDYEVVEKALHRLESIDNAKPSEALELVDELYKERAYAYDDKVMSKGKGWAEAIQHYDNIGKILSTIKQALIQAEKEHNSVNLLMQELDCKDFAELRKYARCGYEKLNKKDLHLERVEE